MRHDTTATWTVLGVTVAACLLAGCGTPGAVDPGVARGPGPAVDGYRLHLNRYTASAGDVLIATVTGPSAPSPSLVEVTCGIRDRRVSYPMPAVTQGPPPRTIDADRRAGAVASASPLRFRVPDAVPQTCSVSRSVTTATGVVQPTAEVDVR